MDLNPIRAASCSNRTVNGFGMEPTKIFPFKLTFDSYSTGGEAVEFSSYLSGVDLVIIPPVGEHEFQFDYDNNKVKVIAASTGAEVANVTDLSALTEVRGVAIGY